MKKFVAFITGMLLISLVGTIELIPVSYEFIYKIPHYLRALPLILPSVIFTPFLIAYLLKERIRNTHIKYKSPLRIIAMLIIYLIGILSVSAASVVFYYIGAAGYEYGERTIPSWVYALWGSVPTFLMLSGLSWLIFRFCLISSFTSEATK